MPTSLVVLVDPPRLQVKPGEQASANLIVRNRTEEVGQFRLHCVDVPPGWAEVSPDQLSAFPGQEVRAQLLIHPPAGAQGATYRVTVRVQSQTHLDEFGFAVLEFDVPVAASRPVPPPPEIPESHPGERKPIHASQIVLKAESVGASDAMTSEQQWRLSVKNAGNVLDTFRLSVVGIPAIWVDLTPPEVTPHPGAASTALLTVRPAVEIAAGTYPFMLSAVSKVNPYERTELHMQVEVAAKAAYTLSIDPLEAEAQGARDFTVTLQSDAQSNTDLQLEFSARDQDNAFAYEFEPSTVVLPARQVTTSMLHVRPREVLGPNDRRTYKFAVVVIARTGIVNPQRVEARLTQTGATPLSLALRPQIRTGEIEGLYRLVAINPSAVDVHLTFSAEDPALDLEFAFRPRDLALGARSQGEVLVNVRARSYVRGKEQRSTPFTVSATRFGELLPAVKADGRFVQTPRQVARGLVAVVGLTLLVGCALFVVRLSLPYLLASNLPLAPGGPAGTPTSLSVILSPNATRLDLIQLPISTITSTQAANTPTVAPTITPARLPAQATVPLPPIQIPSATPQRITSVSGKLIYEVYVTQYTPAIYIMNADGSNQKRLSGENKPGRWPAWMSDGKRIISVSLIDGFMDLMTVEGTGLPRLPVPESISNKPSLSPDGNTIVYMDNNGNLTAISISGSTRKSLTEASDLNTDPAWSPDGHRIAFMSQRDGEWEIYVMNSNGSTQTRLTKSRYGNMSPAWSPDSRKITFECNQGVGIYEICIMNDDGSNLTRLTNSGDNGDPAWSPDGSRIAFESSRDGKFEIYVMNADGSAQTRLTNSSENKLDPAWQPLAH